MAKTQYNVIEAKEPEFPVRALLEISEPELTASLLAFGPDYFRNNVKEMQKSYFHPRTGKKISFREPTTKESILIANYDFGNVAKPKIFDSRLLQAGRIVRTSEGIFANPPRDKQGNSIINEKILKEFLNKAKKFNGIYLCENDFGFAPYKTFEMGVQDSGDFAEGGLARLLEYTGERTAENFRAISSSKFYESGVNVWGFNEVKEPVLKVVSLDSDRGLNDYRLYVGGYDGDGNNDGFVFGVLE